MRTAIFFFMTYKGQDPRSSSPLGRIITRLRVYRIEIQRPQATYKAVYTTSSQRQLAGQISASLSWRSLKFKKIVFRRYRRPPGSPGADGSAAEGRKRRRVVREEGQRPRIGITAAERMYSKQFLRKLFLRPVSAILIGSSVCIRPCLKGGLQKHRPAVFIRFP